MNDGLLTFRGVGMRFAARHVLSDINLRVGAGDVLVLRGANGGGKTTLLRLMAGLLRPTEGQIERAQRLTVGYLPQVRAIDRRFPVTVSQIVRSGLLGGKPVWRPFDRKHRRQTAEMLERMHLSHLADCGIDALSGGQWQRTLLARAIVGEPQLLLLDEPDTHLDAPSRDFLYDLLRTEAGKRAIVAVSHDRALTEALPQARTACVEEGHLFFPD